jgi:hypothetical protein
MGISQSDQKSEQNVLSRTPDFRATSGNVGIKYMTRAGNALNFRQQSTDGKYINNIIGALNTDYSEELSELGAQWQLTGTSSLNGNIGWLNRKNKDASLRDFSGPSSSLNYSWNPNSKLGLTISAAKRTSPLQDLTASYREENSLSVLPSWRISSKTSAFIRVSHQKSEDRGALVALPTGPRSDTTNIAAMGMDWAANRRLKINISLESQKRTSTLASAAYDTTLARVSASLSF